MLPAFERYVGIDYSGAQTVESSLSGLRVYLAGRATPATEIMPPPSPRKYWNRREIAEWLEAALREDQPTLVGIDHSFSFPAEYFAKYGLPPDWTAFLEDFNAHWPTAEPFTYVDFVIDGLRGNGAARTGSARWRRLTEIRSGSAKSVFHFGVPGSVAKSTHAGLPWLLWLRRCLTDRIHFWPFDGWEPPAGKSVVAEVSPRLWSNLRSREDRNPHQHDAWSVATWLRDADARGALRSCFTPRPEPSERATAGLEGWILGVP